MRRGSGGRSRGRIAGAGIALFGSALALVLGGLAVADTAKRKAPVVNNSQGYRYVEATAPAIDGDTGGASPACQTPGGHADAALTGGGIRSSGDYNEAMEVMTSAPREPDDDTHQEWQALVANRPGGHTFNQKVTSYVICDNARKAGSFRYRSDFLRVLDGAQATLVVGCPVNMPVVGGGVDVRGGYEEEASVHSSLPVRDADSDGGYHDGWQAFVDNRPDDDAFKDTGFEVWAICDASKPRTAYHYRQSSETALEQQQTGAAAKCPRGEPVVGGGSLAGGAFDSDIRLNTSRPYDGPDGNAAPDDGWSAYVDNRGFGDETLTAYAICRK